MDNTPSAPTEAPQAPASVESTQTTNTNEPAQPAVDLGLTAEQAQQFKKFMENSGGFDKMFSKIKTDITTPKSAQPTQPEAPTSASEPQAEPQTQPQAPEYKTPQGAITAQEFLAKQYFKSLAGEEKYAPIAEGILKGDYLKEMSAFGIKALNPDGSINDERIRMYLDLKAQTVPAKATSTEPNASTAPTVEYYQVEGDKITSIDQAYAIIMQDAKLKAQGRAGHPLNAQAEEFIKNKGKN